MAGAELLGLVRGGDAERRHGRLDLLAAGALLALGIKELLNREEEGNPPGWTRQLDRFCAMPLPLLLGISSGLEVISPDDLFLFAKTASALLASGLNRLQEALYTAGFTVAASLALLVPFLAVLIGREQVLPWLERSKQLLFNKGDLLVGGLSLVLAGYLGWQGIDELPPEIGELEHLRSLSLRNNRLSLLPASIGRLRRLQLLTLQDARDEGQHEAVEIGPQVHDLVDTRIAQKLAQIPGVGMVSLAGGQRPAVRVQVSPGELAQRGLSMAEVRAAVASMPRSAA